MEDGGMKPVRIGRGVMAVLLVGLPFAFSGCEDKQAQEEIEKLNERIENLESEVETLDGDLQAAREDCEDLMKEANEAEDRAHEAEGKLADAERELAKFRAAEERAQLAADAEPSAKEKLVLAKEKAEESLSAVVTVEGDGGKGRGVVVEVDGKTWLYTAASTLAGNSQLKIRGADDQKLAKFGVFEVASGADLARLEILDEVGAKLEIGELGEKGRLIGVAKDGGSTVEGRSYDQGVALMRADSRISEGDPGGPVFDGESGALVGILVTLLDQEPQLWPTGSEYRRDQRAVYRLDEKTEWSATGIGDFLKEGQLISDVDRITRLVTVIAGIDPTGGAAALDAGVGGGWTMEKVFDENPGMSVIKDLKSIEEWLASSKMKPSERDVNRRYSSVFGQVEGASKRQIQGFDPAKFSPYHRKAAEASLEWRKEADEKLAKAIGAMGK